MLNKTAARASSLGLVHTEHPYFQDVFNESVATEVVFTPHLQSVFYGCCVNSLIQLPTSSPNKNVFDKVDL